MTAPLSTSFHGKVFVDTEVVATEQQLQPNVTQLELDLKKYFSEEGDDAETDFMVSSWISVSAHNGEGGRKVDCPALVNALDLPIRLLNIEGKEGDESNCLALPYLWVGKSYSKLKKYTKSLQYHHMALKVQLQSVGQYEPLTVEILRSIANLHYSDDAATPSSQDHTARLLEEAALRIKWKMHGKEKACSVALSSSSSQRQHANRHHQLHLRCNRTTSMAVSSSWESLHQEMIGDHQLLLSRDIDLAISLYRDAAMLEYTESGSNNMNLAFIYRKIALLASHRDGHRCVRAAVKAAAAGGGSNNADNVIEARDDDEVVVVPVDSDPFGSMLHLPPTTSTTPCQRSYVAIRRGDDYLVDGRYEAAIRMYAKATTMHILHRPVEYERSQSPAVVPTTSRAGDARSIAMGMMMLVLLHIVIHLIAATLLMIIPRKHISYVSSKMSVVVEIVKGKTTILLEYVQRIKDSDIWIFDQGLRYGIATDEPTTRRTSRSQPDTTIAPAVVCDDQPQPIATNSFRSTSVNLHAIPLCDDEQLSANNNNNIIVSEVKEQKGGYIANEDNDENGVSLSDEHHGLVVAEMVDTEGQGDFCSTYAGACDICDGNEGDQQLLLDHHQPELLLLDSVHESSFFGRHSFESLGSILERDSYYRD